MIMKEYQFFVYGGEPGSSPTMEYKCNSEGKRNKYSNILKMKNIRFKILTLELINKINQQ